MSWTDERIERLKKMWTEGATASQIADELGGVSRNAVIGKAHRLGLESRPSPVKPGEEKEKKAKAAPRPRPRSPRPRRAQAGGSARRSRRSRRPKRSRRPASAGPRARSPSRRETTIQYRSVGPGGFIRQGPGDSRRRSRPRRRAAWCPAKPSAEVADKTGLLDLNDRVCRWPMGHPGEPDFHFCGKPANPGFPIASSIAASPTRRSSRAATAARRRRCRSAARASVKNSRPG